MRVCIHRGAQEIGGTCVEVEADGARIVLDVGRPLTAADDEDVPLPDVAGLHKPDPSLVGVLISHSHQDHWGLADQLPDGVPVYMGEATARILKEAAFFTRGLDIEPVGHLRHKKPFTVGPFTITPYLVDHSAFDAYSLLVEADGKRLFYTADLRAHGRKADIMKQLLRDSPTDVDVLLLEGTNIRPEDAPPPPYPTEDDVELAAVDVFRSAAGLGLVTYSAQNIDRLVTLFRAAKQTERLFVMDLYSASIAKATGNENIPQRHWEHVRVYVPLWQRIKVKEAEAFERVDAIKASRIYEEDVAEDPGRYVVPLSIQTLRTWAKADALSGARAIWSLWDGYLTEPRGEKLLRLLDEHGVPLERIHCSGHATVKDLQKLVAAIEPERVVPIHSSAPDRFPDLFERVEPHPDGEWWDV